MTANAARRRCAAALLAGALLTGGATASDAQTPIMLVYLPGAPVESPARLGAAVTELAAYLRNRVPGLTLDVEAFRRGEDAATFLATAARDVMIVMSEPAFLLDLPAELEVIPAFRFARADGDTYHKLVVVKADRTDIQSLVDLRGRTLAVASGIGTGAAAYLGQVVFSGELTPEGWFGSVRSEPDDSSAVASVLFGGTDAALVSDENPLVAARLGTDLRAVYTSPPLSRPVVALRSSGLSPAQRLALEGALNDLDRAPEGKSVLAGLNIDRLKPVPDGSGPLDRAGLLRLPRAPVRPLDIARPRPAAPDLRRLPAVESDQIPFVLGVELVDQPLPSQPVASEAGGTTGAPRP